MNSFLGRQQAQADQHLFTNIVHGSDRYRILTASYSKTMCALGNLQVLWVIAATVELAVMIRAVLGHQQGLDWLVPAVGCVGVSCAAISAVVWRKQQAAILVFSSISMAIYLLICTLLLATKTLALTIPTSIYMCTELLASLFLLQHRSKIFVKFLLLLQLLLVSLKIDGRIECPWLEICFGFVLTNFIGFVVTLSMILFFLVNYLYFKQNLYSVKHVGISFITLNTLSVLVGTMIPIAADFYHINLSGVCCCAAVFSMGNVLFQRKFRTEVVMFLCQVERVKSYNQIISLVKLPEDVVGNFVFIQKSEHWYQKVTKNSNQQGKTDKSLSSPPSFEESSQNKCLICMELQPNMVWMPCGHLTVCQICCDRMLESKSCNCLLCKDVPEAIYHIQRQKDKKNKEEDKQIEADSRKNIHSMSTKDLDMLEASLSGVINNQKASQARQNNKGSQVLQIKSGFSIKIN